MRERVIAFTSFRGRLRFALAVLLLNILAQPFSVLGTSPGQDQASAGNDPGNFVVPDGGDRLAAENEIRRLEFTAAGMKFIDKAAATSGSPRSFAFRFQKVAVGDSVWVAEDDHRTQPVRQATEVAYARSGSVVEKYQATKRGVELQIVVRDNFAGGPGALEINGEVATTQLLEQPPVRTLGALSFYSERGPALHFGPVVASDAKGRQSEVEVQLEGGRLKFVVDGDWLKEAAYPVAVKSSIQTPAKPSPKFSGKAMHGGMLDAIQANATAAVLPENTPVWRVQLRIVTCNFSNARTNDWVRVWLNSNNETWLYSSVHDTFTPGHSHLFDLTLNGIKKLGDISYLQIFKRGSDDWCMKSLRLYVNGMEVYNIDFGTGRWFNPNAPSGNTHVEYGADLRNHSLWESYIPPALPQYISAGELKSRIESIVGDYLVTNTIANGSTLGFNQALDAIQIVGSGQRAIRADMDLRYTKHHFSIFPWENKVIAYDVNAEFDLQFSCSAGKIFVMPGPVDLTYPTVDPASQLDKLNLNVFLLTAVPANIHNALQTLTYTNELGQPACPSISVANNSVYFD